MSAAGPLDVWPQERVGVLGKAEQGAAGVAGGKAARVVCELPGKKTSAKGEEAQRERRGYRRHTRRQ